ncbi:MAG: carbon monoxide dehydrogenase subunit [Frankiales bacterium]|nr:carbon monoxide dehydrogenase subunit [Frankiales bacterium]
MKLENSFTVPVPRADAWKVLMDVERIAPCMPGATLTSREGDSFTGTVKVKVGPINLTYGGQARFVSLDEAGGVAVIEGSGKETRGTGTAKALITCTLVDRGTSTDVQVETDLNVTGKPAQFGRGVLADVSAKLVDRFASCLSEEIEAGEPAPTSSEAEPTPPVGGGAGPAFSIGDGAGPAEDAVAGAVPAAAAPSATTPAAAAPTAPAPSAPAAAPRRAVREAEAIDLMETAGLPVLKRAAPVGGALALVLLAYLLGWRRGASAVSRAVRG